MAELVLLTAETGDGSRVLPALGLLGHHVRVAPMTPSALVDAAGADALLIDARKDLVTARSLSRLLDGPVDGPPVMLVLTEGGLTVVSATWGASEVILDSAPPAEVEARLRMLRERAAATDLPEPELEVGELVIDASGYTARLRGGVLDLTFKEFELLKHLVQHPGRVFTRAQLLQEVWGYDYYGGTRTVDVHVRRLRAKLGAEHDQMIGTVRNVGYRFDPPARARATVEEASPDGGAAPDAGTTAAPPAGPGAATGSTSPRGREVLPDVEEPRPRRRQPVRPGLTHLTEA